MRGVGTLLRNHGLETPVSESCDQTVEAPAVLVLQTLRRPITRDCREIQIQVNCPIASFPASQLIANALNFCGAMRTNTGTQFEPR